MPIYEVNGRKADVKDGSVNKFLKQYPDAKLIDNTPYYLSMATSTPRQSNIQKQTNTQVEENPAQQPNNGIAGGFTTFKDGTSGFIPAMKMPEIKIEQSKLDLKQPDNTPTKIFSGNSPFASKTLEQTVNDTMQNMPVSSEAYFDMSVDRYKQEKDYIEQIKNDNTISESVKQSLINDYQNNIRTSDLTVEDKNLPPAAKEWLDRNKIVRKIASGYDRGKNELIYTDVLQNTPEQVAFIKDYIANSAEGKQYAQAHKEFIGQLEGQANNLLDQIEGIRETSRKNKEEYAKRHNISTWTLKGTDYRNDNILDKSANLLKNTKLLLSANSEGGGFWKGLHMTDEDLKELGGLFESFYNDKVLNQVIDKYQKDPNSLSKEENIIIQAKYVADQINAGVDPGSWYNIGATTKQSLPFMRDFILTAPIGGGVASGVKSGVSALASKTGANLLLSRGIGGAVSTLGKGAIDLSVRPAVQTMFSPSSYAMAFKEMQGQAVNKDSQGNVLFDNRKTQGHGITSAFIENQSEVLGEVVLDKLFQKFRIPVPAFLKTNAAKRLSSATGIQGPIAEYAEEKYSDLANIVRGEQTIDGFFDPRSNLETFGAVAIMQIPFTAINSTGYGIGKMQDVQAKRAMRKAYETSLSNLSNTLGQDAAQLLPTLNDVVENGSDVEIQEFLVGIVEDQSISEEKKRSIGEYVTAYSAYSGINKAKTEQVEEATQEIPALIEENTNPEMGAVVSATIAGMDTPVQITGGNIVQNEDGTINREQSDQEIYYTDAEGKRQVTSINYVENITENIPTQDAIAQVTEQVAAPIIAQQQNEEVRPYQAGETVRFSPDGNTSLIGQIEGQDQATGNYLLSVETPNGIQQMQVQPRQIINEDNLEGVENGSPVIYTNQNGEQVQDVVSTTPDLYAQGLIGFENGDVVKIENVIGLAGNNEQMSQSENAPMYGNMQPTTKQNEGSVSGEQSNISEIDQIIKNAPKQKNGEVDYDALLNQSPLDFAALYESEEGADETKAELESVVDNIQKRIQSEQSKLDKADTINKKKASRKAIAELQARKDAIDNVIAEKYSSQVIESDSNVGVDNEQTEISTENGVLSNEGVSDSGVQQVEQEQSNPVEEPKIQAINTETISMLENIFPDRFLVETDHRGMLGIQGEDSDGYWISIKEDRDGYYNVMIGQRGVGVDNIPSMGTFFNKSMDASELLSIPDIVNEEKMVFDSNSAEPTIEEQIEQAEAETNTNPSEAQKEAGNYKKGKVSVQGFDISIEQPKGSVRSGVDANGKEWSVTMNNTYGYIRGTEGKDGDHIDVFLGNNPESNQVFVVDQINQDGSFDEHKVMLGFDTIEEAKEAYLSNYSEGWQGLGDITEVDVDTFRKWADGDTKRIKPFAEYKDIQKSQDNPAREQSSKNVFKSISKRAFKSLVDRLKKTGLAKDIITDKTAFDAKLDEVINDNSTAKQMLSEMETIKQEAITNGTFMLAPNGKPTKLNENQWLQVRTKPFLDWFGDWINNPEDASKVVDENGEPMVVYHGTNQEFNKFSKRRLGKNTSAKSSIAFFFTENIEEAQEYADLSAKHQVANAPSVERKSRNLQKKINAAESVGNWNLAEKLYIELEDLELGAMREGDIGQRIVEVFLNIRDANTIDSKDSFDGHYVGGEITKSKKEKKDGLRLLNVYDPVGDRSSGFTTNQWVAFEPTQIKSAISNNGEFDSRNPDIRMQVLEDSTNISKLKEKQLATVLKYNPAPNDINTWVRSTDDILTAEEAFKETLGTDDSMYPDFTADDMQRALDRGEVTMYSSYPIKKGIFITPSRMNAEEYSGGEKVYSKTIKLTDVAWIDESEGQYAPVRFMRTNVGDVYGFVTPDGTVYIDSTRMNANTPIHEFGHLWNSFTKESNAELYNRGAELVKESEYWQRVNDNPSYRDLSDEAKVDEALAMAIGDKGEAIVNRNLKQRFVDWVKDVWNSIRESFGFKTDIAIEDMTLSDFTRKAVRNLLEGKRLTDVMQPTVFSAQDISEMEQIKQSSIDNGSFMKAPNGEPTNLTERQWLQVRTSNFKNWFGDWQNDTENASKVIDEKGEPLVVYHGTNNMRVNQQWNDKTKDYDKTYERFTVFDNSEFDTFGHFFTDSKSNAEGYGNEVYDSYLSLMNPLIIDANGSSYSDVQYNGESKDTYEWAEWAKENGYDGAIFNNIRDGVDYGYMAGNINDYVAFTPNQIKSATENKGDFNSDINDIRFQSVNDVADAADSTMTEDMRNELDKRIKNLLFRIREAYEDRHLAVQKFLDVLRENGTEVAEHNDFYKKATHINGAIDAQLEQYNNKYQKPLNKAISELEKAGFDYRDIENYAILKHGLERNAWMKQDAINQYMANNPEATPEQIARFEQKLPDDFSGITAVEKEVGKHAEWFINDFEEKAGKHLIDNLWKRVKDATSYSLNKQLEGQLIDKKTIDDLKSRYDYYVPLRGHDAEVAEDRWDYSPDMGTYFVAPLLKAKGRKTRSESPFAYIASMAQSAINSANRNILNQTILRLAIKDKTGMLNVNKAWYEKTGEQDGKPVYEVRSPEYNEDPEIYRRNIEEFEERMAKLAEAGLAVQSGNKLDIGGLFIKRKQADQHEVHVFQNGTEYVVYINANPAVARAINGSNAKDLHKDLRFFARVSRQMAANFTTRNPIFVASNFSRDYIFSSSILPVKENAKYALQFQRNMIPSADALQRYVRGKADLNKEQDRYLNEYILNGAKTGFSHILELQKVQKQIERDIKKGEGRNVFRYLLDGLEGMNEFAENLSRLSVYITSREQGRSITQSVSDAKEVTVNFNRSGAGGLGAAWFRSLYLFVNAGIQALSNFAKVAQKNKAKTAMLISSYAMSGFLMPMLTALIGGDDGLDDYMKLSDWERQNNLCIYTGNGFIKIPLPHELRVFHKMGDEIYQSMFGKKDVTQSLLDTALGFSDLIPANPMGAVDGSWADIMPDATKPFFQLAANRNFTGSRITNEWADPNKPGYLRVRTNKKGEPFAPAFLVKLAETLDNTTGGDGVDKGLISFNPDVVNHLMRGYFGGLYNMGMQGLDITSKTYDLTKTGEFKLKVRETPLKTFYTSESDLQTSGSGLNTKYFKVVDDTQEAMRKVKGYKDQVGEGKLSVDDFAKKIENLNIPKANELYGRIKQIKKYESALKELDGQDQKDLEKIISDLKKEVIEVNNKLSE